MRISFAKYPRPTGLSAIATPRPDTKIKVDGVQVGIIYAPSRFGRSQDQWSVGLMVEKTVSEEDPCDFRWVFFKARFDAEPDARHWVRLHLAKVVADQGFTLHKQDI